MFNETLEKLIAQHGGNMAALGRALGVSGNYISMLRNKKRGQKPSAEFISSVKTVFGIDIMTGKQVVTDVTRETPATVVVREDIWQEIRISNDFYRNQNTEMLVMLKERDKELFSTLKNLLGIFPKQA